ncbi:MAG: hypothetical protein WCA31_01560 [Acidimicrobiales bacterium]
MKRTLQFRWLIAIALLGSVAMAPVVASASVGTSTLFSVAKRLSLGNCGPGASIVALDASSIYLTGTFSCGNVTPADLIRVSRDTLKVVARVTLPSVTSVAYGDNALWWATGAPLGNAGTTLTPGHGRLLLKVDPTSLKVTGRFKLPGTTELVTVVRGNVWVATPTNLFRVNPANGAIMATDHLGYFPAALAGSYDGAWLYVLGGARPESHLVMSVFSSISGRLLGTRRNPNFSDGPFAVVRSGVWVPVQSTKTQSTTVRLFKGRGLAPSSSLGKFTFDTNAYTGNGILWLVDAGGIGPTVCANPADGTVRARGGPVGVEYGAMAFGGRSTYLLRTTGLNQSLLQILPSSRCSR